MLKCCGRDLPWHFHFIRRYNNGKKKSETTAQSGYDECSKCSWLYPFVRCQIRMSPARLRIRNSSLNSGAQSMKAHQPFLHWRKSQWFQLRPSGIQANAGGYWCRAYWMYHCERPVPPGPGVPFHQLLYRGAFPQQENPICFCQRSFWYDWRLNNQEAESGSRVRIPIINAFMSRSLWIFKRKREPLWIWMQHTGCLLVQERRLDIGNRQTTILSWRLILRLPRL